MNPNADLVVSILQELHPDECEFVGPTNLRDAVDPSVVFLPATGGSNIDLTSILSLLTATATLITSVIQLHIIAKQAGANATAKEMLESDVIVRLPIDKEFALHAISITIVRLERQDRSE